MDVFSCTVAFAGGETTTTTTTLPAVCGDGVVAGAEDCDDGDAVAVAGQACNVACRASTCGKPTGAPGAKPTATDALFTLRSAVGSATCSPCVCDTDASGSVAAGDALRLLRFAVGQQVELLCGACGSLRRQGAFLLQDSWVVPEAARDEVLLERDHVEASGLTLSEDGSVVTWPLKGAAGWWVRIGDAYTLTGEDGRFVITIAEGATTNGHVAHPQESGTPLFAIAASDLVPLDVEPVPIVFERESFGPCGMNDDAAFPDPPVCEDIVPADSGTAHAHHHAHAAYAVVGEEGATADPDRTTRSANGNTEPAFTSTARGTYPAGGQNCCKDYDGGTYDGGTLHGVVLNYYGSTCEKFVSSGCCAGELGSIKNSILSAIGALTPKSCQSNHKGRYCQELTQGNVSVDVDGQIAIPFSIIFTSQHLGESRNFVVHNNGCFGETGVEQTHQNVFGVLTGEGYDGTKVVHYTGPKTYVPDRTLTYTSPRCVGALPFPADDSFRFSTDGKWAEVSFGAKSNGLYRFVPNGPVFSAAASNRYPFVIAQKDQCDGLHVHGNHPCNNAPEPPGAGPCGHGIVVPYTPPLPASSFGVRPFPSAKPS